jgi:hypothetical protein
MIDSVYHHQSGNEDFYFAPLPKKKFPSRTWQDAVRRFVVGSTDDMSFAEVYEMGRAQNASLREYEIKRRNNKP